MYLEPYMSIRAVPCFSWTMVAAVEAAVPVAVLATAIATVKHYEGGLAAPLHFCSLAEH